MNLSDIECREGPSHLLAQRRGRRNAGEGIVHLRGYITGGSTGLSTAVAFELPPGYRPAASKILQFPISCVLGICASGTGFAAIYGPNSSGTTNNNKVAVSGEFAHLEGITFRAES